jgi:hypothetical protein
MKREGRAPVLRKSRWLLLRHSESLGAEQHFRLRDLLRYNLSTVRAYLLKEAFQQLWEYDSPAWAGKFLDEWCRQTMRSRIEPMKKIARSLRNHRDLILNYFRAHKMLSSGVVEGLNNKAKTTMRKSYGFRTYRVLELALYHSLGKLRSRSPPTIFSDEPLKETLAATSRRRGPRAARSSLLLHLHRAMRPPTEPRSQGRKVRACRRPGMCAAIDSALRQAAGSPRRARLKKSRRSVPNVEAPVQGRVPHPPKLQTRPCARRGAICRNAIAHRSQRPRRKISPVLRTLPDRTWVNTRGAAASRRPRGARQRSRGGTPAASRSLPHGEII